MSEIEFTREQRAVLVESIGRFFDQELELELGRFDAEAVLDFAARELGGAFYNRGLHDAQASLEKRVADLVSETIDALEKPSPSQR